MDINAKSLLVHVVLPDAEFISLSFNGIDYYWKLIFFLKLFHVSGVKKTLLSNSLFSRAETRLGNYTPNHCASKFPQSCLPIPLPCCQTLSRVHTECGGCKAERDVDSRL